jgi:hypothetical protein
VLILLLIGYLVYASIMVLTADNPAFKAVMYFTAVIGAWFLGAIYAAISEECSGHGSRQD